MDTALKKNSDRLKEIKDMFSLFSDPLDMYAQLVDVGKGAHNMNDDEKTDKNIIKGCTSKAWMIISKLSMKNRHSRQTPSRVSLMCGDYEILFSGSGPVFAST